MGRPCYYIFMVLVIHVTVAIVSVLTSLLSILSPSKSNLRTTQILTIFTVVSGVVLVVLHPDHLGTSCISGILYLGLISSMAVIRNKKFGAMKGDASI